MTNDRPKRESMSIEEATVSNLWEMAAIVEVTERESWAKWEVDRGQFER